MLVHSGCDAVLNLEPVVAQADAHVVGPQRYEARDDHDQHDRRDHRADHDRNGQTCTVAPSVATDLQRLRALGDRRMVLAHHPLLGDDRQCRRQKQHDADHSAHPEVPLAGHLVVDLRCQHAVVAADHHRIAEVGDHDREHHEGRRQQAVLCRRERDVAEDPRRIGAENLRRLVQAGVGYRQRSGQDQVGVRKAVEHVGDDDAPEPVDVDPQVERAIDDTIAPEQENDAQRLQQRRREKRQQGHRSEHALQRHRGSAHRIGERIGEQHGDQRGRRGHRQAVADDLEKLRTFDIADIVAETDALVGDEAHPEDLEQRQHDEHDQRQRDAKRERHDDESVGVETRWDASSAGCGVGHCAAS